MIHQRFIKNSRKFYFEDLFYIKKYILLIFHEKCVKDYLTNPIKQQEYLNVLFLYFIDYKQCIISFSLIWYAQFKSRDEVG